MFEKLLSGSRSVQPIQAQYDHHEQQGPNDAQTTTLIPSLAWDHRVPDSATLGLGKPTGTLRSAVVLTLGALKGAIGGAISYAGKLAGDQIQGNPNADKLKWVAGAAPTVVGAGGAILLGYKLGAYLVQLPCMSELSSDKKDRIKLACGVVGGAAFTGTLAFYEIGPSSVSMAFGVANITSVIANEGFSTIVKPLIPGWRNDNRSGNVVCANAITDAMFSAGTGLAGSLMPVNVAAPVVLVVGGTLNGLVGTVLDGMSGAKGWAPSDHHLLTSKEGWGTIAQKFVVQTGTSLAAKFLVPMNKLIPGETYQKWINPPLGAMVSIPNSIRQSLANCLLIKPSYGFASRPATGGILMPPAPLAGLIKVQDKNPTFVRAYMLYEVQQLLIALKGPSFQLENTENLQQHDLQLPELRVRAAAGRTGKDTSGLSGLPPIRPEWLTPRVEKLMGRLLTQTEIDSWTSTPSALDTSAELCGWLTQLARQLNSADSGDFGVHAISTEQHASDAAKAAGHIDWLVAKENAEKPSLEKELYAQLLHLARRDVERTSSWLSDGAQAPDTAVNLETAVSQWFDNAILAVFQKADEDRFLEPPINNSNLPDIQIDNLHGVQQNQSSSQSGLRNRSPKVNTENN